MADQRRLSVFITGATGFVRPFIGSASGAVLVECDLMRPCVCLWLAQQIGQSAALALRNRGHHVTALVRSPEGEAAKMLRQHEIVTVVGDITNTASFEHMLASFDVLVSVAQSAPAKQGSEATISAFLGASAASSTPKTVIYTSGCLIYGHRGEELLTEDDDLHACPEAVQVRRRCRARARRRCLDADKSDRTASSGASHTSNASSRLKARTGSCCVPASCTAARARTWATSFRRRAKASRTSPAMARITGARCTSRTSLVRTS